MAELASALNDVSADPDGVDLSVDRVRIMPHFCFCSSAFPIFLLFNPPLRRLFTGKLYHRKPYQSKAGNLIY